MGLSNNIKLYQGTYKGWVIWLNYYKIINKFTNSKNIYNDFILL